MTDHGKFVCGHCRGTFAKWRSDAEAWAEMERVYGPGHEPQDCTMLCDACYALLLPVAGTA